MKFLQELVQQDNEFEDLPDDEFEDLPDEAEGEFEDLPDDEFEDLPDETEGEFEDLPDEEVEDLPDELDSETPEDDNQLDQVAAKAAEDPDRQGVIRTAKGAHLVYKRQTEEGTYEELWVYNSGDTMQDELDIRHAIVSGTDIPTNRTVSDDGKQKYSTWTSGNVEMIHITGLPN